jgi:hypothetical protein
VSLCRIFCLRRLGTVSRVRVSSNPKFRVFLEKVRCEPLFIILGLDFDGCSSVVCPPWCPCAEYFLSEEVWGRESSRVRVFV